MYTNAHHLSKYWGPKYLVHYTVYKYTCIQMDILSQNIEEHNIYYTIQVYMYTNGNDL